MTIEKDIETILDEFDFDRVRLVVEALEWKWATLPGIPTTGDMRRLARKLLYDVSKMVWVESPSFYIATCGFKAEARLFPGDTKTYLSLSFVVSECDNYET